MNEQIKNTIQDCNINFLIGSGLSSPYLNTLGNIELLLTDLEKSILPENKIKLIKISLYKKYFDDVMAKNTNVLQGDTSAKSVLENYRNFLLALNLILLKRKSTILSKEVNIFTTNIDIFLEKALEDSGLEYNDGFNGRFKPLFSLSNFNKSCFKKSLHFDNTAEIPVFNLLKLHGSLSWVLEQEKIIFSSNLQHVLDIQRLSVSAENILDIPSDASIETLSAAATNVSGDISIRAQQFIDEYEKLLVVNPTKEKFKHTLLNMTYYELLRLYSNGLEKENTVLFVMGFSFADEHIREITLRAANSNPTLVVYIIAYSADAKKQIERYFDINAFKNKNIKFISPPIVDRKNEPEMGGIDEIKYDLPTVTNEIFMPILKDDLDSTVLEEKNSEVTE